MYTEHRDHRGRLHNIKGPAVDAPDRKEWWIEGRRHRDDGPAVQTVAGTHWFYWRGVQVPPDVIMDPHSKAPKEIIKIENIEVRRAWMEAYGMEDFMLDMKPTVLDHDKAKDLMLVKLDVPNDEALVMVRVKNSTPEGKYETDGTFVPELKDGKPWHKHYFLRVPPTSKTAQDAVAWTFGMDKKEYAPVVET